MTTPDPLDPVYALACAVFTRPVSFALWKMYFLPSRDPLTWRPLVISTNRSDSYTKIDPDHDLYIYVFRQDAPTQEGVQDTDPQGAPKGRLSSGVAVWCDELVSRKGELHAAPVDPQLSMMTTMKFGDTDPKRPGFVHVGKAVSFARRLRGVATKHYFFASRVRVPLGVITKLQQHITEWVPSHTFEENDSHSFRATKGDETALGVKEGSLVVPVIEPLTIALHLHEYYEQSTLDGAAYVSDPQRQQKVLLAQVLQSVLASDKELYNELTNPYVVDEFLKSFETQVKYRQEWRELWSNFLVNWLDSGPFEMAAQAHLQSEAPERFLIVVARSLGRLSEAASGRSLLLDMYRGKDPKWQWVSEYIFRTSKPPDKIFKIVDKANGALITALKEWAVFAAEHVPAKIIVSSAVYMLDAEVQDVDQVIHAGERVTTRIWLDPRGGQFVVKTYEWEFPKSTRKLKTFWKGAFTGVKSLFSFVSAAISAHDLAKAAGDLDTKAKKGMFIVLALNNAAKDIKLVADITSYYKDKAKDAAKSAVKKLGPEVEEGAYQLKHAESKAAEASAKAWKRAATAMGFIGAVTDVVLGVGSSIKAYKEGETRQLVGSVIATVGSGIEAAGYLWGLLIEGAGGPLAVIGAAFVIVGKVIQLFVKSDYQHLIAHSCFGSSYGKSGPKKNWAVVPFEQWKDRYDLQLSSGIQLLCQFDIKSNVESGNEFGQEKLYLNHEPGITDEAAATIVRTAKLHMSWVPAGSRIEVEYEEAWKTANDNRQYKAAYEIDEKGKAGLAANSVDPIVIDNVAPEFVVAPWKTRADLGSVGVGKPGPGVVYSVSFIPNPEFRYAKLRARLVVPAGDGANVQVPYENWKEEVLVKNPNA